MGIQEFIYSNIIPIHLIISAVLTAVILTVIFRTKLRRKLFEQRNNFNFSLKDLLNVTRNIHRIFTLGNNIEDILNRVCKIIVDSRNYNRVWIVLIEEGKPVEPIYHYGFKGEFAPMTERLRNGLLPDCMEKADNISGYYITDNSQEVCRNCPLPEEKNHATFTSRIIHGSRLLGYLCISIPGNIASDEDEIELLRGLANEIGYAIWAFDNAESINQLADRNAKLLEYASDGIISLNKRCEIIAFNPGAEKLLKMNAENVIGKDLSIFRPGDMEEKWNKFIAEIQNKGFLEKKKTECVSAEGKSVFIEFSAYRFKEDSGTPGGYTIIIRDITFLMTKNEDSLKQIDFFSNPDMDIENLKLTDLYDLENLQKFQDEFSQATGVASIITDPRGNPITKPSNFCELCKDVIRQTEQGKTNCFKSDRKLGNYNPDGPNIHQCFSGGLWDAGAGIVIEGRQIANWMIGQVCDNKSIEREKKVAAYVKSIGGNEKKAIEAFRQVPYMPLDEFRKIARFLHTAATQLSEGIYQSYQQAKAIEQRKRDFIELENNQEYLSSIFRAAPIGIGVVVNRIIRKVNTRFCNMLGYSEEEMVGKNSEFLYPDRQEYERVGSVKYKQIEIKGTGTVESKMIRKDGTDIDVIISSSPLDLEDLSKGVTFSVTDITHKKKIEAESQKLTLAIEQSMDAFVITDKDGSIEYVNPAFVRITGYTLKEVLGKNPRVLKSGEHEISFYQNLWNTISMKKTWRGRMINRKKDGSLYTEDTTISPVINKNGEIINYIAIKRDISSVLQMEKEKNLLSEQYRQAQKVESIGRLAGGIAHDLNNLLSPILGYSELLKEEVPPENPEYYKVEQIMEAGLRAKDLVHQLLAFSRKQSLKFEVIDLPRTITGFKQLLKSTIREDITIKIIEKENVPHIKADKGQIEQVIINLAVNAQDAMPKGGQLIIETGVSEIDGSYTNFHPGVKPGQYAMLIVSDTGCGMSPEIQNQIFEPFFSTKGETGTGLGLATVYGIVKQHGGNIWVYSEVNRGTTFKIYLPAAEEIAIEPQIKETEIENDNTSAHILLAEDNPEVRQLCETILTNAGYRVTSTNSGEEAVKLIQSGKFTFNMLLTDIIMPGINGKELFTKASSLIPDLKVLYMSGYTDNVIDLHFNFDQEQYFIQKPFSNRTLLNKTKEILNN